MEIISLLSVERLLGMSSFMKRPNMPPKAIIRMFRVTGRSKALRVKPVPSREVSATEMAME